MYIAPIHNLRHLGLVANGFQKEDAPAPTPDQNSQPDLRNRSQALTDTRHAVEVLNPVAHMETNALNRVSFTNTTAIEMGREETRAMIRHLDDVIRDKHLQDFERNLTNMSNKYYVRPLQTNTVREFFDSI